MEKNKNQIRLSPSSIQSFRACPLRYRRQYIDRVNTVEDKEALRVGTNYHAMHEIAYDAPPGINVLDAVIAHLDKTYETCPDYIQIEKWEQEKFTLLYSYLAYCEHYQEPQEIIASEIKFDFPLRHPRLGHDITDCAITGRIDKLIKLGPRISVKEYKTTSWDIGGGSDYWRDLERHIQPRTYVYALHRMIEAGEIEPLIVSEIEYDVFKKPGIRPKKPTKKDVKIVGGGFTYHEQFFEGEVPDIETGAMFGARLYIDITMDPFKYFARRPITVLAQDIAAIEFELYNLYSLIKYCKKNNFFDVHPDSCTRPFKCEYKNLCDIHFNDNEDELPSSYKRGW